jgi:hypothetical protein
MFLADLVRYGVRQTLKICGNCAYNTGIQHTRLGVKGINSGVNTKLGNTTGQDSGGIQMGEGSGRGGISQIIGRDIDGLDGGNRTLFGGSNTFLPI